jgi:hypothetical protein
VGRASTYLWRKNEGGGGDEVTRKMENENDKDGKTKD